MKKYWQQSNGHRMTNDRTKRPASGIKRKPFLKYLVYLQTQVIWTGCGVYPLFTLLTLKSIHYAIFVKKQNADRVFLFIGLDTKIQTFFLGFLESNGIFIK